jgi:hypothetical protein
MKPSALMIAAVLTLSVSCSARAQTPAAAPSATTAAAPVASAPVPDGDPAKRLDLATKMADLSPPREVVEMAINQIISTAPAAEQQELRSKMMSAYDFDGFRQTVIKSMADTFSEAELQAMVNYNSTPESKSIAKKMNAYQSKIRPDMTKKLDVALMVARTGRAGEVKAPATPKQ